MFLLSRVRVCIKAGQWRHRGKLLIGSSMHTARAVWSNRWGPAAQTAAELLTERCQNTQQHSRLLGCSCVGFIHWTEHLIPPQLKVPLSQELLMTEGVVQRKDLNNVLLTVSELHSRVSRAVCNLQPYPHTCSTPEANPKRPAVTLHPSRRKTLRTDSKLTFCSPIVTAWGFTSCGRSYNYTIKYTQ